MNKFDKLFFNIIFFGVISLPVFGMQGDFVSALELFQNREIERIIQEENRSQMAQNLLQACQQEVALNEQLNAQATMLENIFNRMNAYQPGQILNLSDLQIDTDILRQLIPYIQDLIQNHGLLNLNLSHNKINYLPANFVRLNGLYMLNLSYNQLRYLYPNLSSQNPINPNVFSLELLQNITTLRGLNLSHNDLTFIPKEFSLLIDLQALDLSHNRINFLPNSFSALVNLHSLNLEEATVYFMRWERNPIMNIRF